MGVCGRTAQPPLGPHPLGRVGAGCAALRVLPAVSRQRSLLTLTRSPVALVYARVQSLRARVAGGCGPQAGSRRSARLANSAAPAGSASSLKSNDGWCREGLALPFRLPTQM